MVAILPLFSVGVSPMTFVLADQCDGLTFGVFGGENDSEPRIVWNDDGFAARPYISPAGPMLPGQSRTVAFSDHSSGEFPDDFCNANFSYTIAINLLTFNQL